MRFLAEESLYRNTAEALAHLRTLDGDAGASPDSHYRFHMYLRGPFTRKLAFAVKSFLVTQDLGASELWLWLDRDQGYEGWRAHPLLRSLAPFLEVRCYDPAVEAAGTPLESHEALVEATDPLARSDAFRLIALYRHGGIYVDADTMFLRDLGPLLRDPEAAEFSGCWSSKPYGNSAILRLRQGGEVASALLGRAAELGSCHPRLLLPFEENADLDLLTLPSAYFDPLWLHRDGRDRYADAPFDRFEDFFRPFGWRFRRKPDIRSFRDFFPGAFAYHWHGLGDAREHENSYFGAFERELERLMPASAPRSARMSA